MKIIYCKKRIGVLEYEYDTRPWLLARTTKVDHLLSIEEINLLVNKNCCWMNCIQFFLRPKIIVLRNQMWCDSDFKFWKHTKVDIHCQFHDDQNGNSVVTFKCIVVCSIAWCLIMGISRAMFFQNVVYAIQGIRDNHHRNMGTKKPCTHIVQATTMF